VQQDPARRPRTGRTCRQNLPSRQISPPKAFVVEYRSLEMAASATECERMSGWLSWLDSTCMEELQSTVVIESEWSAYADISARQGYHRTSITSSRRKRRYSYRCLEINPMIDDPCQNDTENGSDEVTGEVAMTMDL
jgi:hypothetical protein